MIDVQPYIDKLNKIPDWVSVWVDCRLNQLSYYDFFWKMYYDHGILMNSSLLDKIPPTFEQYLKTIK